MALPDKWAHPPVSVMAATDMMPDISGMPGLRAAPSGSGPAAFSTGGVCVPRVTDADDHRVPAGPGRGDRGSGKRRAHPRPPES
jgi:hypothetical protein